MYIHYYTLENSSIMPRGEYLHDIPVSACQITASIFKGRIIHSHKMNTQYAKQIQSIHIVYKV